MKKTNRMRATFSEKAGEIKGTITLEGDCLFALECLALQVENIAAKINTTPEDVARDLYAVVTKQVTP